MLKTRKIRTNSLHKLSLDYAKLNYNKYIA